jgi:hypothetical protein
MITCDSRRIQLQDQGTILTNGRFAPEAVSRNLLEVPRSETTNQNRERGYALSPIELRKRVMRPQLASMLRVDARELCGVP